MLDQIGNITLFWCQKKDLCNVTFECFSLLNTVKTAPSHTCQFIQSHLVYVVGRLCVFRLYLCEKWQHLNICTRLQSTERANICTWKASWSFFCSIRAICRSGQKRNSKDEQQLTSVCICLCEDVWLYFHCDSVYISIFLDVLRLAQCV